MCDTQFISILLSMSFIGNIRRPQGQTSNWKSCCKVIINRISSFPCDILFGRTNFLAWWIHLQFKVTFGNLVLISQGKNSTLLVIGWKYTTNRTPEKSLSTNCSVQNTKGNSTQSQCNEMFQVTSFLLIQLMSESLFYRQKC